MRKQDVYEIFDDSSESCNLVLDKNLRQVLPGDYVLLPSSTSGEDKGMVLNILGSTCEIMIMNSGSGIPETAVIDFRHPDPSTGLFGRSGYLGIQVCARKGKARARDFARQLMDTCHEIARQTPTFNPYLMAQANTKVESLSRVA